MTDSLKTFDIVIVGGGLVGMSMAVALADSDFNILLVEQSQASPVRANILDLRTTGITRSSQQAFRHFGIWEHVVPHATPIQKLVLSEQGNFGGARIDATEFDVSPIGHMVPNHHLIDVLSQQVSKQHNLTIMSSAALVNLDDNAQGYALKIVHNEQTSMIQTSLLIGADGANSKVRELLNISAQKKNYHQTAIITNIRPNKPHKNIAYERFTDHGPLAVLPIQDDYCALIWTQPDKRVDHFMQMNDQSFLQALQSAFGYRLGQIKEVGQRSSYPLSLVVSDQLVKDNAVLVGNAAQAVHPVAAQGFNLGLRDVQALVQILKGNSLSKLGYSQLLNEYENQRMPDRAHVIRLTDGLTRVFAPQIWPVRALRGLGVRMIGKLPILQRSVLRRNTGMKYFLGGIE